MKLVSNRRLVPLVVFVLSAVCCYLLLAAMLQDTQPRPRPDKPKSDLTLVTYASNRNWKFCKVLRSVAANGMQVHVSGWRASRDKMSKVPAFYAASLAARTPYVLFFDAYDVLFQGQFFFHFGLLSCFCDGKLTPIVVLTLTMCFSIIRSLLTFITLV